LDGSSSLSHDENVDKSGEYTPFCNHRFQKIYVEVCLDQFSGGSAMQRKLTAIVAADVVDYSIHLGRNEIGTLHALNIVRREVFDPIADKYSGKIVRVMGDGSLLSFESALDAIKFAMDAQSAMAGRRDETELGAPIEFRMGANLCDIICQDGEIHGEGVNVAVRLEELAPPGGVCLSHSIYLQTKSAVRRQLLPIGERHLKNIADPVFVWRWHPKTDGTGVGGVDPVPERKQQFRGRQVLDPQVTALLVDLHMRSARLAVSDAFDAMLAEPDEGRGLSMEDIYRRIGQRLNTARALLHSIYIEPADDIRDSTAGLWQTPQAMSEFISNAFDNAGTSYAARLLPQIQKILQADTPPLQRRSQFMALAQGFMREDMAPQVKNMIKFAFVETA
jgi:class 3 adenylate cyclase